MLELTGIGSVLRALGILYWLAAIGVVAATLWFPKRWWFKAGASLIAVALFGIVPAKNWLEYRERQAYAKAAWEHFRKLCAEKSGEKIYKTFTGVKSVLVVKPLPPATEKDLFDQFWYGDPYSSTSTDERAKFAAVALIGSLESRGYKPKSVAESIGFDFVEIIEVVGSEKRFLQLSRPDPKGWPATAIISNPASRFAVSWDDISTPGDRTYWIAGSHLRVIDMTDNSLVAERIGFLIEAGFGSIAGARRPWQSSRGPNTTCPKIERSFDEDRYFIHRALSPAKEQLHGK